MRCDAAIDPWDRPCMVEMHWQKSLATGFEVLSLNIGHEVSANHPLFAWAFQHAGWLIDRNVTKANVRAYELVRGHGFCGKLCQYGEPVMCYVADTTKRKGDAR